MRCDLLRSVGMMMRWEVRGGWELMRRKVEMMIEDD